MKLHPETPGELRKLAAHSHTSVETRAHIGCAILLSERLAALELTLARVLDVLVKHADARSELGRIGDALEQVSGQLSEGVQCYGK